MSFPAPAAEVSWLTAAQMAEVDRLMIEEYRIELLQMMENAGRSLAEVARRRFLAADPRGRRVEVLAGPGGNGGGALVAARRLHGYGAEVGVVLSRPAPEMGAVPAHQLLITERMGVPVAALGETPRPGDVVIDGLIGYSLRGAPTAGSADLIGWANRSGAPILALDLPSGLDATTGISHQPTVRASATLTLALPKEGLRNQPDLVGELYLADIGVPSSLYSRIGLEVGPVFAFGDVVRLSL